MFNVTGRIFMNAMVAGLGYNDDRFDKSVSVGCHPEERFLRRRIS